MGNRAIDLTDADYMIRSTLDFFEIGVIFHLLNDGTEESHLIHHKNPFQTNFHFGQAEVEVAEVNYEKVQNLESLEKSS